MLQQLHERKHGLRFYGITPPKRGQDAARLHAIAERQVQRIASLQPDGLILYDLQDEAARTGVERPFPFLPTLEPTEYARDFLAALPIPKIVYKCVQNHNREQFLAWLDAFENVNARDACVLVGAPSNGPGSQMSAAGLTLPAAYDLLRQRAQPVTVGGVAIAERHARRYDEDERLLAKYGSGCRFFISQTVYDPAATKSLLSDYALRFGREGLPLVPFILSFSPCGSLKTMEFMKWLGISFPRWLENELRYSPRILEKSVELAKSIFADVQAFAREKAIPIGINVESVSIRKEEIDASGELFSELSKALAV